MLGNEGESGLGKPYPDHAKAGLLPYINIAYNISPLTLYHS